MKLISHSSILFLALSISFCKTVNKNKPHDTQKPDQHKNACSIQEDKAENELKLLSESITQVNASHIKMDIPEAYVKTIDGKYNLVGIFFPPDNPLSENDPLFEENFPDSGRYSICTQDRTACYQICNDEESCWSEHETVDWLELMQLPNPKNPHLHGKLDIIVTGCVDKIRRKTDAACGKEKIASITVPNIGAEYESDVAKLAQVKGKIIRKIQKSFDEAHGESNMLLDKAFDRIAQESNAKYMALHGKNAQQMLEDGLSTAQSWASEEKDEDNSLDLTGDCSTASLGLTSAEEDLSGAGRSSGQFIDETAVKGGVTAWQWTSDNANMLIAAGVIVGTGSVLYALDKFGRWRVQQNVRNFLATDNTSNAQLDAAVKAYVANADFKKTFLGSLLDDTSRSKVSKLQLKGDQLIMTFEVKPSRFRRSYTISQAIPFTGTDFADISKNDLIKGVKPNDEQLAKIRTSPKLKEALEANIKKNLTVDNVSGKTLTMSYKASRFDTRKSFEIDANAPSVRSSQTRLSWFHKGLAAIGAAGIAVGVGYAVKDKLGLTESQSLSNRLRANWPGKEIEEWENLVK